MFNFGKIVLIGVLSLGSLQVSANGTKAVSETASNKMFEATGWSFSLGTISFDSEAAFEEGIDKSAFSFDLAYTGYSDNFIYAAGFSGMLLSDNDSFSQTVEDNRGDISSASSSAQAFGLFGEIGYSYLLESGSVSFDLMGGLEAIWAERSIASCSNCYSEDIDINAGLYVKPRVTFYKDTGFAFSIAFQKYLGDDIEAEFSLNFAWYR